MECLVTTGVSSTSPPTAGAGPATPPRPRPPGGTNGGGVWLDGLVGVAGGAGRPCANTSGASAASAKIENAILDRRWQGNMSIMIPHRLQLRAAVGAMRPARLAHLLAVAASRQHVGAAAR